MDSMSVFFAGAFVGMVITLLIVFGLGPGRSRRGGGGGIYRYDHRGRRVFLDDDEW